MMRDIVESRNWAIALAWAALFTELWRGYLDAMFVFPVDIGDRTLMNLAAVVFTLIFAAWIWSLVNAGRGSRRGLFAAFGINGLMWLAVPVSWLVFYCPAACRAEAGVFNLANTLNLLFGLAAAVGLGLQLRRKEPDETTQAIHPGENAKGGMK
jgi:hypothetical protein